MIPPTMCKKSDPLIKIELSSVLMIPISLAADTLASIELVDATIKLMLTSLIFIRS